MNLILSREKRNHVKMERELDAKLKIEDQIKSCVKCIPLRYCAMKYTHKKLCLNKIRMNK